MNGITHKQLLSLQSEFGIINSLIKPLDMIRYEKNAFFRTIKFFSILFPFFFFSHIQNYLALIAVINIIEAVINDFVNGNHNNALFGCLVAWLHVILTLTTWLISLII